MAQSPLRDIESALRQSGLILRGGFDIGESERDLFPEAPGGQRPRAIALIGAAGGSFWNAFSAWMAADPARPAFADPLDAWTREIVTPLADASGARAIYPFEPPWQPFQRWAQAAEPVHPSPVGIFIHPDYGLWHAYRAALVYAMPLGFAAPDPQPSPCETCADKPCLSGCPAGAFSADGYDLATCAGHLAAPESRDCHLVGCRARDACPVGRDYRYGEVQRRFHMAAFIRARGVEPVAGG
ncbi:ferredoxin [Tepidamorphus sp. 3E244]|uniref:ferredoxin n=1 Tax=Tepidamorphus sp. 3E244 TaxID=3385498 RepID=UPI0038FD1D5B